MTADGVLHLVSFMAHYSHIENIINKSIGTEKQEQCSTLHSEFKTGCSGEAAHERRKMTKDLNTSTKLYFSMTTRGRAMRRVQTHKK